MTEDLPATRRRLDFNDDMPESVPEFDKMAYRLGEAAAILGTDVTCIQAMTFDGYIRFVTFGRQVRIPHDGSADARERLST